MKTHTRKHWLLLAALCAAGSAYAGPPASRRAIPPAAEIMLQTIGAYASLGPVTVHEVTVPRGSVHRSKTGTSALLRKHPITQTVLYNDASHFRISYTKEQVREVLFANGQYRYRYRPAAHVYFRTESREAAGYSLGTSGYRLGTAGKARAHFNALLLIETTYPGPEQTSLRNAIITRSISHGEPTITIRFPKSDLQGSPLRVVISGRDHLIREVIYGNPPETYEVSTFRYIKRSAPFPPQTFMFRPPAGVKLESSPRNK